MGRLLPAFLSSLFEEHGVHPSDVSIVVDNPQSLTSILLSSEEGGQSESSLRISLDDSVVIATTSHHSADDASLSLSPTGMLLRRRPFSLVLAPSPSTKASTKEQRRWDSMSSSDSCLFAPPRRKSSLNSVSTSGGGAGGRRHYLQYSSDEDQHEDCYESDDGVRTSEHQQHQPPSYSRSLPLDVPASAAASSTTRSHPTRRNSRHLTQPRPLMQPSSKPAPSTTFQHRGRMVKSRSAPLSAYASAASSSVTSPRPPRRLRSIDFAEAEPPLGEPRMDPSPPPSPPPPPPPPPPTLPTRMTMVKTKHPPSHGGGDRRIVTHGRPHHAWQRPSPPSIAGGRAYETDGNNKDDSTSTSATALSSSSSSSLRHGEGSPSPPRRVRSALLTTTTTAMGDRTNAASAATTSAAAAAAVGPPKRRDSFLARMRMFHPSNALPQTLPGAAAPAPAVAVAKIPDE